MLDPAELRDPRKILIWDLDGTIVDTGRDIASGVAGLFRERGLPPPSREAVIRCVGRGVRVLVTRCFEEAGQPLHGETEINDAVRLFREHYARHLMDTTVPYPGLPEILRACKARGQKMGVVSNKPEDFTQDILRALGLFECFAVVLGGDSLSSRKPSPEPLLHVLHHCDQSGKPSDAIVIGDSVTDLDAARAAGMPVCGVAWGFDPEKQLEGAELDWWITTPEELREALLGG
jgi:phosphoglycolate phosphatase